MTDHGPASRAPSTLDSSEARRSAAPTGSRSTGNAQASIDSEEIVAADLVFVRRLIDRDGIAWGELTTKYRDAILRGVSRGFAELGVAMTSGGLEEVCAEVVFVLFKNECAALRKFQGRSRFGTWLTVVSRRVCLAKQLNHERSVPGGTRTTSDVDMSTLPERGSSAELAGQMEAEMQAIQACLPRLAPDDRSIIERFFLHEQSYQEIADQLGITKNAVGPKLTRARNRLRRLVALHRQHGAASSQKPDPRNPKHGS